MKNSFLFFLQPWQDPINLEEKTTKQVILGFYCQGTKRSMEILNFQIAFTYKYRFHGKYFFFFFLNSGSP